MEETATTGTDVSALNDEPVSLAESSHATKEKRRSYVKKMLTSKRLPVLIRNWTFTLSIVILIVVLVKLIIADINDDSYRIQAFSMPQDFIAAGYDGSTTAYLLLDRVDGIIREGNHTRSITAIEKYNQNFEQNEVRLEVSGIGISPEAVSGYFRKSFGVITNTITGEVVREDRSLKLFLRITGEPTQVMEESIDSTGTFVAFEKVIQRGAESILKMNNPTLLGLYYGNNNKFEEAFESFRFAIQKNPRMAANIYAWWGEHLYYRDRDTTYAMPKIRQALSIDPNNAAAYNIWGNMNGHFEFEELISVLKKATDLDPNCVACWNDLGATFDNIPEYENEAILCYEICYALDETYVTSMRHWANLLFLQGRVKEASEMMERARYRALNRNHPLNLSISLAQNDRPEALVEFRNLKEVATVNYLITYLNGLSYKMAQRGHCEIGFRLIRFALEQDSTTSFASLPFSTLAELEALTGNNEGFYRHIDKAFSLGLADGLNVADLKQVEPYKSLWCDERFIGILTRHNIDIDHQSN